MNNLIAELERATEGSRELDHEIFLATHPKQGTTREGGEYRHAAHLDEDGGPWVALPQYTTSLDAALTLVPEGWGWAAAILDKDVPSAVVTNFEPQMKPGTFDPNPDKIDYRSKAATPALALCTAALHARQAIEEDG